MHIIFYLELSLHIISVMEVKVIGDFVPGVDLEVVYTEHGRPDTRNMMWHCIQSTADQIPGTWCDIVYRARQTRYQEHDVTLYTERGRLDTRNMMWHCDSAYHQRDSAYHQRVINRHFSLIHSSSQTTSKYLPNHYRMWTSSSKSCSSTRHMKRYQYQLLVNLINHRRPHVPTCIIHGTFRKLLHVLQLTSTW